MKLHSSSACTLRFPSKQWLAQRMCAAIADWIEGLWILGLVTGRVRLVNWSGGKDFEVPVLGFRVGVLALTLGFK